MERKDLLKHFDVIRTVMIAGKPTQSFNKDQAQGVPEKLVMRL